MPRKFSNSFPEGAPADPLESVDAGARSNSTASQPTRRSSRPSLTPSKPKPEATTPKKKPAKRARSVSVVPSVAEAEDEEDEEEGVNGVEGDDAATPKSRKRKAASPAPKAKKAAPTPKIKPKKVPIKGINPIPRLFHPELPTGCSFKFPTTPNPSDIQTAFVFGNGDFGQHGLGVGDDVLCEIKRPRLHKVFEEKIAEGGGWAKGVAEVECGGMHTLAIDADGKVSSLLLFTVVPLLPQESRSPEAGSPPIPSAPRQKLTPPSHRLQVYSWGINDNAALGRITSKDETGVEQEVLETQPMLVSGLQEEDFKAVRVAAGDSVSIALSDTGELRCWGSFRGTEGLLGFDGRAGSSLTQITPVSLPNLERHTIVQVATGDDHFVALTSTGQVFTCGNGEQNQLGRRLIARHKANGLTPTSLALRNIVVVGSGSYHSFGVDTKGQVFGWGLNSFRQLGISEEAGGWEESFSTPTLIEALSPENHGGAKVVQIAGGTHHSLFLFENGEVWGCGRCDGYEVGLDDDHPEMVAGEERKKEALELREKRRVEEVALLEKEGTNEDGEPLKPEEIALKAAENAAQAIPLPNPYIPLPTLLEFPTLPNEPTSPPIKIVSIATGTRHNFAISSTGHLYSWGFGNTSQLGQGPNVEQIETPTLVLNKALGGFKVTKVASGGQHSICLAVRGEDAIESEYY